MMICLDIGNTHIYGGVFRQGVLVFRFRYPSKQPCTSDVFGLFLKDVLHKNGYAAETIQSIVLCSVVPILDYSIVSACKKYFSIVPLVLKPGVKTGLSLRIHNPAELGADRIANAVAAISAFPKRHIIIVDFGTATTLCAISRAQEYLGGAILPGMKVSMEALSMHAAKILEVDLITPEAALGKTTVTQVQSGLYYGQLGAIEKIIQHITHQSFPDQAPVLVATGGYAHLFQEEGLFSVHCPDLVLQGLRIIGEKNSEPSVT